MARTGTEERKISVRISGELADKVNHWEDSGISLSDTVRLALSLLPYSPDQFQKTEHPLTKIKPMRREEFKVETKDEKEALKSLQDW